MELKEKKSLQFELWEECGPFRCTYCYLGKNNIQTSTKLKIDAMEKALAFLNDEEKMKEYNVVSYIGGEFFQGQLNTPEVKSKFHELMHKTAELQISGKIKEFWLMCTLNHGEQKDLYEVLDLLKARYTEAGQPELMHQIWIVTSYDTIGRFHTQKMHDTWDYHMQNLHKIYPELQFNVCTILTGDLVKKYINDEWSFEEFIKKYHTSMFFKQPNPGAIHQEQLTHPQGTKEGFMEAKQIMEAKLPGFFPKREDFLAFLIKFKAEYPTMYDKLFNIQYRADDLYRNYNDEEEGHRMQYNHREKDLKAEVPEESIKYNPINDCGHLLNYAAYIDADDCMICDRELIRSQF